MIVRDSLPLVLANLILLTVSVVIFPPLAVFLLLTLIFLLVFFRDPHRKIGDGVVSPADGKIDYIGDGRLEIFMSPIDCHVNRAPVSGKVVEIRFREGSTPPAFLRKENVRMNEIIIENEDGLFRVIQIAGIFARRIVCYLKKGQMIEKGERIGMIRFGSRVVLEVPDGYRFTRNVGEKVKAGETVAVKDENI